MEKIPQFHCLKIRFTGDTFATVERFSNTVKFLRCISFELHSKSDFVLTTVTPRKMSFASRFSKSKERKKKKIDVVSVFLLFVVFIHHKECETYQKRCHTLDSLLLAKNSQGRAAALQNMNLHDSRQESSGIAKSGNTKITRRVAAPRLPAEQLIFS